MTVDAASEVVGDASKSFVDGQGTATWRGRDGVLQVE
jgi:hypothetical protein